MPTNEENIREEGNLRKHFMSLFNTMDFDEAQTMLDKIIKTEITQSLSSLAREVSLLKKEYSEPMEQGEDWSNGEKYGVAIGSNKTVSEILHLIHSRIDKNKEESCGTYQMTARCMCEKGCGGYNKYEEAKEQCKKPHDIIDKGILEVCSSPQSPLSEFQENLKEIWKYSKNGMCPGCGLTLEVLKEIRLEAQRELAEELLKDIQFDLDKGRFYSICSNETALKDYIRGLLPKITE